MNKQKHSRAKGLEPKPCCICKELFQPFNSLQKTCGKEACPKVYDNEKAKESYHQRKEEERKIHKYLSPDKPRRFQVEFYTIEEKWYWKAIGDNGSKLSNGPFCTIEKAKKDYESAI